MCIYMFNWIIDYCDSNTVTILFTHSISSLEQNVIKLYSERSVCYSDTINKWIKFEINFNLYPAINTMIIGYSIQFNRIRQNQHLPAFGQYKLFRKY